MNNYDLALRLKRLRQTEGVRNLLAETRLHPADFVAPLFIHEGLRDKKAISSMPGQFQLSLNNLPQEIDELSACGIQAVLLFGIPLHKDAEGSSGFCDEGIVPQAIRCIKEHNPAMLVVSDVCFCEYTSHGHCGILDGAVIDNDKTLLALEKQALSHARAGADWVAPSGMTDGMVKAIRRGLDREGFVNTVILSYAAKYCSSLYTPFRHAAEGAPQFGDRKSYQLSPANSNEALREVELDLHEGADLVMVKPAMYYLDIIYRVKQRFPEVPLCAYQVSGEYSMLKQAAAAGLINEKEVIQESLLAIKRAGADFIISYFAKEIWS